MNLARYSNSRFFDLMTKLQKLYNQLYFIDVEWRWKHFRALVSSFVLNVERFGHSFHKTEILLIILWNKIFRGIYREESLKIYNQVEISKYKK